MADSKPPKHGQIVTAQMPRAHARKHLDELTQHVVAMKEYNGHGGGPEAKVRLPGDTGQSSQGGFGGGASGAQYTTTNVGSDVGDSDSQGPTGF